MSWPIVMVGQETHLGGQNKGPLYLEPGLTSAFIFEHIYWHDNTLMPKLEAE